MSDDNKETSTSRADILGLMDSFIEKMLKIRKIMLGVSISAMVLTPLAIGLSIILFQHPRFLHFIQKQFEFGTILTVLLLAVIVVSAIWLVAGIRQYLAISSWNKRYLDYLKDKEEINRKIASQFGLD